MALEQYLDNKRINIKMLTSEKPKKKQEIPFDVEKEISEEDWQNIKEEFDYSFRNNFSETYHKMICLVTLFPQRITEFSPEQIKFYEKRRKQYKNKEHDREESEARQFFFLTGWNSSQLEKTICYFPEAIFDKRPNRLWEKYKELLNKYDRDKYFKQHTLRSMHLLFSGKASVYDQENIAWKNEKDKLDSYVNTVNWNKVAEQAMIMKVFFPSKFSKIDFPDSYWKNMKNLLNEYRKKKKWHDFEIHAMQMQILAAKKIERTEAGLKLIMSDSGESFGDQQQLPKTRKF